MIYSVHRNEVIILKTIEIDKKRHWLQRIRQEKKLTYLEVSRRVGISKQGYWSIESGDRNPSVPTAKKIAMILEFDWTDFF